MIGFGSALAVFLAINFVIAKFNHQEVAKQTTQPTLLQSIADIDRAIDDINSAAPATTDEQIKQNNQALEAIGQ